MAKIIVSNLSFFYEANNPILKNINHVFDSQESVAIIGPSGCGKTTLLHILARWIHPQEGSVEFIRGPNENHISFFRYIFSSAWLINELTVQDNIFLDRPKNQESLSFYKKLMDYFDISDYGTYWPKQLSSGQQQRVGVMRALLGDGLFLLADEPTSHLDPARAFDLMKLLLEHLRAYGRGLICVTHDPNLLSLFDTTIDLSSFKSA